MPDKKLTDNEIIKALECCVGDNDGKNCFDCPLWEIDGCQEQLLLDVLDLINRPQAKVIKEQNKNSKLRNERNRLQAENERLKENLNIELENYATEYDYKIKAEAYKEFAERLKDMHKCNTTSVVSLVTVFDNIDNLLKELVGGNNETKTF